jgi:hypothetical protein
MLAEIIAKSIFRIVCPGPWKSSATPAWTRGSSLIPFFEKEGQGEISPEAVSEQKRKSPSIPLFQRGMLI